MDDKTYQLMLDDIGELVALYNLPLGEMMNQSPRNVLRDCIARANVEHTALSAVAALVAAHDARFGERAWADHIDFDVIARYRADVLDAIRINLAFRAATA